MEATAADWITAAFTVVLAIVTGVLAVATGLYVSQTKRLVKETRKSRREMRASRKEACRAREQSVLPKLALTFEYRGPTITFAAIHSLVKLRGLDLDPDLVRFITTLTYGGAGNDFRHGTATDRWQLRSTFLTAALLGWLDTTGSLDARDAVRAAACREIWGIWRVRAENRSKPRR